MSTSTLPILIVGAGPSGLAAALTLAQHGIPIRIIDKATEFHQASRGTGIHPRTAEMYRFLGVLEDLQRLSVPIVPLRMYKLPGGTEPIRTWNLFEGTYEPSPDRPESMMAISQYLNEGVFRDHLSKYGVHVQLSTEPTSMEQDAEGVTVTLKKTDADGTEKTETTRVAYVVGADGARGITRKMIGATFEGQTKDADGQVWADVVAEGMTSDYWNIWSVEQKTTIAMRPKGGNMFHVGIVGIDFDPVDMLDKDKFVEFFYENTGRKDVVFKEVKSLTYWKPKMRMVNKLSEGRVFIIGDAAHVHPPSGGQGLNTGVQDAINLSWKLALTHKGLASPELLSTFQTERIPVITHMLMATTKLYTHLVSKKAEDVQQIATNKDESTFLGWRDKTLHQLEINYRWSPAVVDARGPRGLDEDDMKARAYEGYPGGDIAAGDRAPNVPALVDESGKTTALFDLFKPYMHTLIVFVPEAANGDVQREVETIVKTAQLAPAGTMQTFLIRGPVDCKPLEGSSQYHDDGFARKIYHMNEKQLTVVVVRPDAYVGALVYGVDGLRDYFSKVFKRAHWFFQA